MGLRGFPPWMSHEPMFQILAQSVETIQSYWSTSVGYRNWVLMMVRENDLECFLMFYFNYLVTTEFPFAYPHVYRPLISALWSSFAPFILGESERNLGVRSLLEFFERKEDLASIFQVWAFHPSFSSEKTCLSMKTQTSYPLSLVFSTQSIFSSNFKTFLSSNSMRPTHPPWIVFTHFLLNVEKYISYSI